MTVLPRIPAGLELDVKASLRSFRASPLATVMAVVALGVAAAVTTTLVAYIDLLFFRPLPFSDPGTLYVLSAADKSGRLYPASIAPAEVRSMRAEAPWRGIGTYAPDEPFAGSPVEAATEGLRGVGVDHAFFDVLGTRPVLGRVPAAADTTAGRGRRAVVIGYRLWTARFGRDPSILERDYILGGQPVKVVGVMPVGFSFPRGTNVWASREVKPDWDRFQYLLAVVRASGETAHVRIGESQAGPPSPGPSHGRRLQRIAHSERPTESDSLWMFAATAVLIFAIGWLQLAVMQLARLSGQISTLRTRVALGASARRVAGATVLDGAILALAALVVALMLLKPLVAVAARVTPPEIFGHATLDVDWRTVAALVAVVGLGCVLFAVAAVRAVIRWHALGCLHQSRVAKTSRMADALAAAQLGCTALVAYIALLLGGSALALAHQDLQFEPRNLYVIEPRLDYRAPTIRALMERLEEEIALLPGVVRVARSNSAPVGAAGLLRPASLGPFSAHVRWWVVGDAYRETIGASMVAGRWFGPEDRGRHVAVVNETLAQKAGIDLASGSARVHDTLRGHQIIGIMRDVRSTSAAEPAAPEVYSAVNSSPFLASRLIVRITGPDRDVALASIERLIREATPNAASPSIQSTEALLARQQAPVRSRASILVAFAVAAIGIGMVGVYSSVTDRLTRQRRELGIRLSLGASPDKLRSAVTRPVLRVALLSGATGCLLGFWAGEGLRAYVFGLAPVSPWLAASTLLMIVVTTFLATLGPAAKAASTDPALVLRD